MVVGGRELDAELDDLEVMSSRLADAVGTRVVACPLSVGAGVGTVEVGLVSCRFPCPSAPTAVKEDKINRQSRARPHKDR